MKQYLTFVNAILMIVLFLNACQTETIINVPQNTIYIGPAHLTLTNLDSGETNEKSSTIDIGIGTSLPEYHLTVECGGRMEMKFSPMNEYADKKFDVIFKFLGEENKVTSAPYSKTITVPSDTPEGIYTVECSAMCDTWREGSSCTQSMTVKVE
ncbi:MAG: hypothetical protein NC335_00435 [Bacteroides sp.]|nr:hypothetical protein [Bacteroides sp.]